MFHPARTLAGFVIACATSVLVAPASAQRLSEVDLESQFGHAVQDAAQLCALIEAASQTIAGVDAQQGHGIAERLHPFCQRAFFSPEILVGMEFLGLSMHTVRSGEIPGRIAKRYSISAGLLPLLNDGYDERKLQVGQRLKVLDARGLTLIADTARFRLAAWTRRGEPGHERWLLLAYWPIGTGAEATATPLGRTTIVERALNPSWTDPVTHAVYPHGDPSNILGGYWIRLEERGLGKPGIGMHGYTKDNPSQWLGKRGSNGCLRLTQHDVTQVFHLALEGTPVTIVE